MKSVFVLGAVSASIALLLSACGGGGGGGGGASSGAGNDPLLSGVAAVGAPIVGATVKVKCAGGPDVKGVVTAADGSWQATITGNTLPCAVQVSLGTIRGVANTSETYHSLAMSPGIVNVTPLTDLITANTINPTNLKVWFDDLPTQNAATLNSIDQKKVDDALVNLRTMLSSLEGISNINPITVKFNPVAGDPVDDAMEAYRTSLQFINSTHDVLKLFASNKNSVYQSNELINAITEYQRIKKDTAGQGSGTSGNFAGGGTVPGTNVLALPNFTAMKKVLQMVGLNTAESYVVFADTLQSTIKEQSHPYQFTNMSNGLFTLTDSKIKSSICMSDFLPSTIPVNRTNAPDNAAEYAWITEIDTNLDGKADYLIQASRYKKPGEVESQMPLASSLQHGLWKVNHESNIASTNTLIAEVPVEMSVDGKCLQFEIDRYGVHEKFLSSITEFSKVRQYTQAVTTNTSSALGVDVQRDVFDTVLSGTGASNEDQSVAPVIPPDGAFVSIPSNGIIWPSAFNVEHEIGYLDILRGSVYINDDEISATMHLRDVPNYLTFNNPMIPNYVVEHDWKVEFDVNDDGKPDYVLVTSNVKSPQDDPNNLFPNYSLIKDGTKSEFRKHYYPVNGLAYSSMTLSFDPPNVQSVWPTFSSDGNALFWNIKKNLHPELKKIPSTSKIRMTSYKAVPWYSGTFGVKSYKDIL